MQDATGISTIGEYPLITAKAPMLHWGQATMYQALALLLFTRATQQRYAPGDISSHCSGDLRGIRQGPSNRAAHRERG